MKKSIRCTQPALGALTLVLLAACSTLPAPENAATTNLHSTASGFTVEDLDSGALGGMNPYPHGVSADGGVIVGQFYKDSAYRAFHWENGVIQELGTLGGVGGTTDGVSADGRVVVGTSQDANGRSHAARWNASGVQSLGTLGGDYARINAVSADGSVVVGYSSIASGRPRAFRWENGVMQNLGTLGGDYSWAEGVSADGSVVVGSSYDASGKAHAVLWTSSGIQDLGTLGDSHTFARAISADGKVVVGSNGDQRAFRWEDGTMQDLGDLGITVGDGIEYVGYNALHVNRDGSVVVGSVRIEGSDYEDSQQRIFQWKNGTMQDIGSLGGSHTSAQAISADGSVVVGKTYNASEQQRAYRWTATEGMQELELLPGGEFGGVATGVTADGSVVVGSTYSTSGYRAVRWTSQVNTPTDDGDGIAAAVDGRFVAGSFVDESETFSNFFTDQHLGGSSFGEVSNRSDLQVSVTDSASAVEGLVVTARNGGGTASVKPCGTNFTMSLKDGDSVIATCGSLTAEVIAGKVDITLANGAVVTVAQQGATAHISEQEDGNFLVENLAGTGDVVVTIGELTKVVEPGTPADAAPYNFTGFFQPIDRNGVFNIAKEGSVIPVKFSLSGDQGLDIFATGYPKASSVPCPVSTALDSIEQTATTSGLKYDATTDQYNYSWKTGSWAGTCRRLDVMLLDGKTYSALFKFK